MNFGRFLSELRRRNVYKVAVAYLVGGWALAQGIAQVLPVFDVPNWIIQVLVLLIVVGFPVALVLAWTLELTPEGLKTTEAADAMPSPAPKNRAWMYVIIVGAIVSVSLFFLGRYSAEPKAGPSAPLTDRSVAVLPFENLSNDPENAYFSEGVQDEILTRLAKIAELKVVSKTSTQGMKSAPADLRQIAQQLGVTNIVEGSVQRAGEQVRVNVQLINAMTNAHLWAESYDRKLTDIFAVESEIARSVAGTLQAKLTGSAEHVLTSRPTENPEAYQLYLKGRYFWNRRTPENIIKALNFFQQAIDRDAAYALAWSGVADAYSLMPIYANNPPREDIARAISAARKAVELDDTLAEAHTSLANALVDDLHFATAEEEFKKAISLNPNYATAHQWYGESLQAQGRFEEALTELKKAYELDPLSLIINAVLAAYLGTTGHTEQSIQQFQRTLEMEPDFAPAFFMQAGGYELRGDLKKALELYERANNIAQTPIRVGMVARIYALTGRVDEARKILNELTDQRKRQYVQAYPIGLIHLALNEKDQAIKFFEAAYDERGIQIQGNTGSLVADKRLDPLRDDPRFKALVAKFMGNAGPD